MTKVNIFLDLDGVMVDLGKGLHDAIGRGYPEERMPEDRFNSYIKTMYADVADVCGSIEAFWATVPPLADYRVLFDHIVNVNGLPTILTATPKEYDVGCPEDIQAANGKKMWVKTFLSTDAKAITTRSNKKQTFIVPGEVNILIDDYIANIKRWRYAGGIAIHHTDIKTTIDALDKVLADVGS